MTLFERAFARTVGLEGDFSNNKNDAGGATRYGITEAVARAHGYLGDMRELPFSLAQQIAKLQYWDPLRLDDVGALYESIASELFDTSYNCGTGTAAQFLQRSLNAFNHRAQDYPDVAVDGAIGPATIAALNAYAAKRGAEGELVLHRAIESLKGARYITITEGRPALEDFCYGWILNRLGLA